MDIRRMYVRPLIRLSLTVLSATSLALAAIAGTAPSAAASAGPGASHGGLAHVAYFAGPSTPITVPSAPSVNDSGVAVLDQSPANSSSTNADIADYDAEFEAMTAQMSDVEDKGDQIIAEADALQAKADPFDQKVTALNSRIDAHNGKVSDLQARIDAHNAKPNTFTLPDQQAEADAYQAEADELNGEKSALDAEETSLQAQKDQLDAERTGLTTELNKLQSDIDALDAEITTVENKQQELENKRQTIAEEMATDEENAITQQEAAAALPGMDSPGATAMAEGGDAPQPIDESDPSTQSSSSSSVQSDPAIDDSAGGDMPSEAGQNAALDTYGQQNGVTVIEQPVTVELPPQALRSMSPTQAAQVTPSATFQGVVREPSGNYKAIEVVSPGSGFTPGQAAFNNAINQGARATTTVDGRRAVIDATDTVVEPGPSPAPAPAPSGGGTPAPSTSRDDENKDCRDDKPGGAEDLPNRGWVLYGPLGPNGRATGMLACLFGYGPDTKTNPQVEPVGWDAAVRRAGQLMRLDPEDRNPLAACHFLAARFNGSNTDKRNFTTCWQNPVNVSGRGMSGLENAVADDLKSGMVVAFSESAVYETLASDTPVGYNTNAYAQKPGTSRLLPIGSPYIPNAKLIDGVEENIGN